MLAGLDADGETTVVEPEPTRDHTERALRALGGPVVLDGSTITVSRFQQEGFDGSVPGDPSSAAFVIAAAALTGSEVTIEGVGLNPTRLHFLDVMARMGVHTERRIERSEVGEPVGDLWVAPCPGLRPVRVAASEIASVIDEIPILAMLAQHADGDSWFLGVAELKVKESDRLAAIAEGILDLGGHAGAEGADLVVAGGGLDGGTGRSGGDHRMAMALMVAALRARGPVEVDGVESADVSFPGFVPTLNALGASIEVVDMTAGPVRVVAIDGAAGSGKSTLARGLAARLALPYINTGLMYRALTAAALAESVSIDDEPRLVTVMARLRFSLDDSTPPQLQVDGWSGEDLVTLDVEANVSSVARHPGVRTLMRAVQRRMGIEHGAVMEGRDIGSVVFDDAPVKLYLEADPTARANRRVSERKDVRSGGDEEAVGRALLRRDERDAMTNPHVPADGAIVIDTTDLDAEETLRAALVAVEASAPELIA